MVWVEIEIDTDDVRDAVVKALNRIDLCDYIDLDYDDVRYQIEDEILEQVMDYVDVDEIAERVQGQKEDLDDAIQEWINNGCPDVDTAVDELLQRGERFKMLERRVERLVEHMALPEERTSEEQIYDLIDSGGITLAALESIVAKECGELRLSMKRMNKYELIGTAQKMGYDVNEDMTIAQIHEVVGL